MESEHGITCECGQTFKTSEEHTRHVAIREVLAEVKRIGGEKFYKQAKAWEEDAHSGDYLETIEFSEDGELSPREILGRFDEIVETAIQNLEQYVRDEGWPDNLEQ